MITDHADVRVNLWDGEMPGPIVAINPLRLRRLLRAISPVRASLALHSFARFTHRMMLAHVKTQGASGRVRRT